jgi:hypothetical protein
MTHTQKIGEHGSARLLNEDILLAALVALNMAKTGRTYLKMDSHPIRIPPLDPTSLVLFGEGPLCLVKATAASGFSMNHPCLVFLNLPQPRDKYSYHSTEGLTLRGRAVGTKKCTNSADGLRSG